MIIHFYLSNILRSIRNVALRAYKLELLNTIPTKNTQLTILSTCIEISDSMKTPPSSFFRIIFYLFEIYIRCLLASNVTVK